MLACLLPHIGAIRCLIIASGIPIFLQEKFSRIAEKSYIAKQTNESVKTSTMIN
jgi:hypothetical protein